MYTSKKRPSESIFLWFKSFWSKTETHFYSNKKKVDVGERSTMYKSKKDLPKSYFCVKIILYKNTNSLLLNYICPCVGGFCQTKKK